MATTDIDYHDRPEVSRSDLWLFHQSRRMFRAVKDGLIGVPRSMQPPGKFDALDIGTVSHTGLLEREKLAASVAVWPETRSGKVYQAFSREMASEGRVVLTTKGFWTAYVAVLCVRDRLARIVEHPEAKKEELVVWDEPVVIDREERFVSCRCRLDYVVPANGGEAWVLDLKTTSKETPEEFDWSIEDYGYWLQDAHYTVGAASHFGLRPEQVNFLFVPVSKPACELIYQTHANKLEKFQGEPLPEFLEEADAVFGDTIQAVSRKACWLHRLPVARREQSRGKWKQLLEDYARCVSSENWSDPGEDRVQEFDRGVR